MLDAGNPTGVRAGRMFGVLLSVQGLVTAMQSSKMHIRPRAAYGWIWMNILKPLPLVSTTFSPCAGFAGAPRKGS
jgi:hypothetical protein